MGRNVSVASQLHIIFHHFWTRDLMTVACLSDAFLVRSGSSCDAANIIGIANSIIMTGLKAEETIVSRDLPATSGELGTRRLGDGVKRALGCKLVPLGIIYVFHLFFSQKSV